MDIKKREVFNIQKRAETKLKTEAKLLSRKWSEWKLARMRKQALKSEAKLLSWEQAEKHPIEAKLLCGIKFF